MNQNNHDYVKKPLPPKFGTYGLGFAALGLILSILALVADPVRASFDSLIVFVFLIGMGMCSLFLIGLEYLTGAVWSVPFRRIAEYLVPLVFIAPIFAIPVFFNFSHVFQWANPEYLTLHKTVMAKTAFLNPQFFYIRITAIIVLVGLFSIVIIRNSAKQDNNSDQNLTKKNIRLSAGLMPIFGLGITLIGIDWIMSLEPLWFSTIFGVYYFAGSLLTAFAAITLIAIKLKSFGALPSWITKDHFYNLGAFLFAFINFWAYIAFSQFMLIWYANLPEETFWFLSRTQGSWLYISIGIIFIKFIIPYAGLLSQPSKSNINRLKYVGWWIIFAQFFDLYWLIMPTFSKSGAVFSWTELGFPLLGLGLVMILFKYSYTKRNLIPIGDPKLKRAMDFHL